MNFAQCLHIVLVIGKHTQVFRGIFSGSWGEGGYMGGYFHGGSDSAMKRVSDFPALFKKGFEIK
jgi:hypothetical protein